MNLTYSLTYGNAAPIVGGSAISVVNSKMDLVTSNFFNHVLKLFCLQLYDLVFIMSVFSSVTLVYNSDYKFNFRIVDRTHQHRLQEDS